jgi:hypothetical protein
VLLFCGSVALAQVNEQSRIPQNWLFYRKIQIKNPQSVLSAYTYDRLPTDIFILIQLMGFPLIINYIDTKQYESLVLKESMRDYFKKKTDTIDGKEGSEAAKKDLLPNIT